MSSDVHARDEETTEAAVIALRIWRFCCLPLIAGTIFGLAAVVVAWWVNR